VRAQPQRARPFLSLKDATFRLGDRLIFEKANWVFHDNEHWAVVGANGSGKSLFADALRGRLPLVQGDLRYHFTPPAGLNPEQAIGHVSFEERKSDVHGFVVQSRWNSFETEAEASVGDLLSYERVMEINPFEVRQTDDRARAQFSRRLRRAITLLRLRALMERRLLTLSNGERQRVELARALCQPLRLLILDEPYMGLDASSRAHFHRVLEQLMLTSVRVLLLTTRVEDLPAQTTHLMRIDRCRIIQAGCYRPVPVHKPQNRHGHSGIGRFQQRATTNLSPKRKTIFQLRDVTVRYETRVILREFNWTVSEGESCALLGPNGSGKSTLLSLISGDNPQAYKNEVMVFGKRRGSGESIWELKRQIGVVSPELQLHFNDAITCFEAVASGFHDTVGLFAPPTPPQRVATARWLERFGLREFAHSPLFLLSAGLQRMVLLARALVKRPRLLLLDEPCQGLDEAHRTLLISTVDRLIRTSRFTAIYVTHRPEEIPSSIKRVKRLSLGGRI
jgi:molybdate transport system ATP-binding protein